MSNALYAQGRERFLGHTTEGISWINDTIKCSLVSSSYTPSAATHTYLSSITAHTGSTTAFTLVTKTATTGTADAGDATFSTVAANSVWNYVVIWKEVAAGTIATSPLIAVLDTATGLPVTSSGGDIIIQWDNGANKIFTL